MTRANLILLVLLPFLAIGQDTTHTKGMHFEHDLSWTAIQAKAKAEHKYIFVDCYTTWCGPCRYMSTTIFPMEQVGTYFNDKFICVKVQLDTTAKDDAHTKSWYADGHNLATQYNVRAYPTYLVFAPDGQPLHRLVGSNPDPAVFINGIAQSFDTSAAYYTRLAQYQAGRRDTAFLRKLTEQCSDLYDMKDGHDVAESYFASLPDLYTSGTLQLLVNYTEDPKDRGFAVFTGHADKVDAVMGRGYARSRVITLLLNANLRPAIKAAGGKEPDWKAMQKSISVRFPDYAPEVTSKSKVLYYQSHQDWPHFQTAIVGYMQQFGTHATPTDLNDYAWTVFQNCPDMTCVADALDWSKRSFKDQPNPAFMDTYANILYKMGRKDDAITWEQKAADLTPAADEKAGYLSTIDKMKKGEKTWN
jgi:thiol-disulfide isomerase/thioredoxin